MKILECPLNGPRNITEFTYGGEYHPQPDASNTDKRTWAEHLYFPENKLGIVVEWWCHVPSSYWFLAERNTATDQIMRTFPADTQERKS